MYAFLALCVGVFPALCRLPLDSDCRGGGEDQRAQSENCDTMELIIFVDYFGLGTMDMITGSRFYYFVGTTSMILDLG